MNRTWYAPFVLTAALMTSACAPLDVSPPSQAPAPAPAPDPITDEHKGFAKEVCKAVAASDMALASNLLLLHGDGHAGGPDAARDEAKAECPDQAAALDSLNGSWE